MADAGFTENIAPADATAARISETVLNYNLVYNGSSFDLSRSVAGDAQAATGIAAVVGMGWNGTNYDRLRTEAGTTGFLGVGGSVAHDAVDAGNPVKVGGKANDALPTQVSNGDRSDLWVDRRGATMARITDASGSFAFVSPTLQALNVMVLNGSNSSFNGDGSTSVFSLWQTASGSTNVLGSVVGNLVSNGTSWDKLRSIAALDAAPNVDTGILAAGVGPGWDRKQNPAGVAATSTANAVTVTVDGADMISFEVTTIGVTPGSMVFEVQGDDSTWVTAGMVIKLASGPDVRIEGSFVPAVGDVYLVRVAGHRQVRYRVNATYASGTATVKWTGVNGVSMVKSIDMPPPPHNIGYAVTGISAQYTTTQTSTTLGPTVSSTQRLVVTSIQIQATGTVGGDVQVYFGTGAFSRGTSKPIFDGAFIPSATSDPGFAQSPSVPYVGAADEELKVTTSAAINKLTVTIWYYLVAA